MRLADYVFQFFARKGLNDVFLVTGGGAMHLNDAIARCPDLRYTCCHHEQSCAMAAESYARLSGKPAIVNVTTGPGGINALNGVFGAWTDSIPMIVISGQVKRETCMDFQDVPGLRQLGDQETNIISMVKGITKYASTVRNPEDIRIHLEKAFHAAVSGRPGPVWMDIPIDIQGAPVDPDTLVQWNPSEEESPINDRDLETLLLEVHQRVSEAKRPVILVGGGIRAAGVREDLIKLLDHWNVPVVTAWNAHDVIWDEHRQYAGRPGTIGDRAGNLAVQNSDLLLILGSRLNIRQVGYAWQSFARESFKIWVEIDGAELNKPTVKADLRIQADLKKALPALTALPNLADSEAHSTWLAQCHEWRRRYPVVQPEYRHDRPGINPYAFVEKLFTELDSNEVVVCADGTACVTAFQAARLLPDQRLYTNSGSASMGYDLPAAIGAAIASGKRVVCLAGDGSIQMNLQELQTIRTNQLPVKIFWLNNNGYHSIRQTQQNFFGLSIGIDPESGVGFPEPQAIAQAYGLRFHQASRLSELSGAIQATLTGSEPAICEIKLDITQPFAPKQSSRRLPDGRMVSEPLENLSPFLDRDELLSNLFIAPLT